MKVNFWVRVWLLTGIALIFLMVFIGGATRLTNSGLSIVEWDLFSEVNPFQLNEENWNSVFEKYKQYPEYKTLNAHFTVEEFKQIFWWEYIHRMLGRFIGLIFIIPYLIFTLKGLFNIEMQKRLLLILFMGAFQGFLGWFMVKSGLIDRPSVSHFRLSAHLITAFLTCAYTYWVYLEYTHQRFHQKRSGTLFVWVDIVLIFVVIQIVLGGFVAGLDAGKVFNSFPKMGEEWIAPQVLEGNLIETMAGVQFLHRYNAYILSGLILVLALKLIQLKTTQMSLNAYLLTSILVLQIAVGIFTLLYHVPTSLALLHQILAFILLLLLVRIRYYLDLNQTSD